VTKHVSGEQTPKTLKTTKNVHNFLYSPSTSNERTMGPDSAHISQIRIYNSMSLEARRARVPPPTQCDHQKPDKLNVLEKIRFPNPTPGDVITVNVTGTSITMTDTQAYSLVASGPFVSAAWYSQDNRGDGPWDTTWRTEYCTLPCTGTFKKRPLCCETLGGGRGNSFRDGNLCHPSLANASKCSGLTPPQECPPSN